MVDWFIGLDPTVQIAIVGALGGGGAAIFAWFRAISSPKTDEKREQYEVKPTRVELVIDENDRRTFSTLINTIDNLNDTLERHRHEISSLK